MLLYKVGPKVENLVLNLSLPLPFFSMFLVCSFHLRGDLGLWSCISAGYAPRTMPTRHATSTTLQDTLQCANRDLNSLCGSGFQPHLPGYLIHNLVLVFLSPPSLETPNLTGWRCKQRKIKNIVHHPVLQELSHYSLQLLPL